MGYFHFTTALGAFVAFTLNTLMSWRSVFFIGLTLPIISTITLLFVSSLHYKFIVDQMKVRLKVENLKDSRNATMVAIKKSNERSRTVSSMASRMDLEASRSTRALWTAATQWTIEIMWFMHQTRSTMFTPATNIRWKIDRFKTTTKYKAIHHFDATVFLGSIQRHPLDVTVCRTSVQSIRKPNGTRSRACRSKFNCNRCRLAVHVLGWLHWQTMFVSNNGCCHFGDCFNRLFVRIHCFTARLYFVRSTKSIPFGWSEPRLYSNDWPDFVDLLLWTWHSDYAMGASSGAVFF